MLALVLVLAVLAAALVVALIVRERRSAAYRAMHPHTAAELTAARSHSVATSKGTTLGQAAEHLAPFFPELVDRFSPADWRFLGSPVDFVVFDGLSAGQVQRVVLVEVKSGDPRLNARQAQLRAACVDGLPVEWMTVKAPRRREPRIVKLPPGEQ